MLDRLYTFSDRGESKSERRAFERTRRQENEYGRKLRKIADNIATMIDGFDLTDRRMWAKVEGLLDRYAETITPWAQSVARLMVEQAARSDEQAWAIYAKDMGSEVKRLLKSASIGDPVRALMEEQVNLITSLPREAALRVHAQALEGLSKGERPETIAKRILETGEVTKSRATLIARTETGRASTTLTQVRATHIGSISYVWRTAKDSDVRPSHKKMEGKVVLWSDPPTLDGMTGHAAALPNCRCYPEPIIPDV